MQSLSRREWLAVAAGVVAANAHGADAKPLPFGYSLYGMKGIKPADAIKTLAEIGYDGIEFALMPGYGSDPAVLTPADRKELRKRLADSGLTVHGVMENLGEPASDAAHKSNLERLKLGAEFAHAVSPDAVPPIETVLGGKPAAWDDVKDKLADRLTKWAELATAAKVVIAIKPHVANALHTVDAAKWLIAKVNSPAIRLAFDASHFVVRKVPVADVVDAIAPLSVFAHVKDATGTPEKFAFLLPGDGDTDYPDLLIRLAKAKYTGPVVVEVSAQVSGKAGFDAVAAAKKCYANLAPAFAKIGRKK